MTTRLLIIGGSDAGISAGWRVRELDLRCEVTIVVADRFPNYSSKTGRNSSMVEFPPASSCRRSMTRYCTRSGR